VPWVLCFQVGGMLPGGIQLRGLSGGERKRLAIACGVVAGPSLVFLDEPTSGLDSFAALNVVLFLKSMANTGATLIASLHQPRSAIWGQLDQVGREGCSRALYSRWLGCLSVSGMHAGAALGRLESVWLLGGIQKLAYVLLWPGLQGRLPSQVLCWWLLIVCCIF